VVIILATISIICSIFLVWLPNSIFDQMQYNFICSFQMSRLYGCVTTDTKLSRIFGCNHSWWIQYNPNCQLTPKCHVQGGMCDENNGL
jgi:hypothetical protein